MNDTNKMLLFDTGGAGTGHYTHADDDRQVACIANIGATGRMQRLRFGLVGLTLGAILGAVMVVFGIDPWWRLVLFLPFSAGAAGYFQARDKT